MVDVTEKNTEMETRLIWDYCIVDWKNVQLDGEDVPCTTENKVKLMKQCLDFAKFVTTCIDELAETNKALEEARLKNSESTSNGS